jgi:serine/threonine protein kinase
VPPEKLSLYRLGLKSFFEEGRSLAQISHASVVSVLNFFRENETVYMVMNYLEGATLQDFMVTARDLKKQKVFRESTIRSLFDEILRGLRIVHQHKMLHLDIKPANIFITDDNRAVLIDFGAAREVLSKEGNFIRPMYTPGFAAPEMYRRDSSMGPWTDIYAIGACIYACMQGYPPNDAPQRIEKDRSACRCRACAACTPTTSSRWSSGACRSTRCRARNRCSRCKRNSAARASAATPSSRWARKCACQFDNMVLRPRRACPSRAPTTRPA